jgi:hypothetical protein
VRKAPYNIGFKSLEFYASDSWKASGKLTFEHNLACVIS